MNISKCLIYDEVSETNNNPKGLKLVNKPHEGKLPNPQNR
jgi:hypothetical protein